MIWISVSKWVIRLILIASFIGIFVSALLPGLAIESRINSIGVALQIAGIAFTLPELAQKLSNRPATDLLIWGDTFLPLWQILRKVLRKQFKLGQLLVILSVLGIILLFVGLGMQYLAAYFNYH